MSTDTDRERIGKLEALVGELANKLAVELSTNLLIPELAAALRELHDFGAVDTHYRYAERSQKAFDDAEKLLKRLGY